MEMENKTQQQIIKESKQQQIQEENKKVEQMKAEYEANDIEFEQRKAEITAEVKEMLKEKGIEVVDMDYSAGKEIVGLINAYNETIDKINKEMKYNSDTYKNEIAKMKNCELHLDKNELKRETIEKLEKTLEKQEKVQEQLIKDKQADPKYKEMKSEAFGVLNLLKDCSIPTEQLMDILSPIVESSDTKALGICKTLLQNNPSSVFAIEKAITGIEEARANNELKQMINTMKDFINNGNDNLSYFMYMSKFR